ncbi:MAG: PEP-CTERM sorting domain-containing protein [Actinobacteria bacterium]|nr:PEP-CTERM sorting domain-containing protein [Actinomycetota bacterium]NBV97303.1 PEP-CTERM sorting domain-containing protein [Verrucomicrobiota bacterium]
MKNKITIAIALLGISLAGSLQAQTVNLINNLQPFYMGNGTTLLKPNTEIYIGTFGSKTTTEIQGLLGSDQSQNYNNLFSNFSILGSYRAQSSEFGVVFGTESGETETGSVIGFNGNQVASFFNNKPMQVLVLSPLNGENSPGNLLEIGVYGAYDFGANAAINFMTADITDVNSFAFATADLVAGDPAQIGATAIVGNGGPTGTSSFSLSTSSVPEPSSASLLLLGASALVSLRRLRKNV